ncbi:deoxycytidylate deaminase [Thermogymnomonas acidicola]|uniref:deoxycytidylate deaminase n=1 Tax=Thermogymnomonas acidicola TaxID=399579 RepID=UPI00166380C3|nr:dCMP deaminase family protein [Thermogymnomonas acidicola]
MQPDWDTYFMRMAFLAASRSNCVRRKVGAVIVKDRNVLATGYNGPPSGSAHCDVAGCVRNIMDIKSGERHELCRGLHAEQNAIIQAAVHGVSIKDAVIYVTTHPCVVCAKMLINAHIREIVYAEGYPDDLSELMLIESDMSTRQFSLPKSEVRAMLGEIPPELSGED